MVNHRTHEICPIRNGSIVNLNAFLQFLKLVYGSILSKIKNNNNTSSNDNNTFLPDLTNIPILIISNYSWTNFQIEKIVQFSFEHLKFIHTSKLFVYYIRTYISTKFNSDRYRCQTYRYCACYRLHFIESYCI